MSVIAKGSLILFMASSSGAFAGAIVTRDSYCPVIDANGVLSYDSTSARIQFVETPSGQYSVHCTGQLPVGAAFPDRAIQWGPDNFPVSCYTSGDEWKMIVTPSGQVKLTCNGRH